MLITLGLDNACKWKTDPCNIVFKVFKTCTKSHALLLFAVCLPEPWLVQKDVWAARPGGVVSAPPKPPHPCPRQHHILKLMGSFSFSLIFTISIVFCVCVCMCVCV